MAPPTPRVEREVGISVEDRHPDLDRKLQMRSVWGPVAMDTADPRKEKCDIPTCYFPIIPMEVTVRPIAVSVISLSTCGK